MNAEAIVKVVIWSLILLVLVAILFVGLAGNFDLGRLFNFNLGSYTYANAELYSVGASSINAADIRSVEIHWVNGGVDIVQSGADYVTFTEDYAGTLEPDEQLRYMVDGGKLIIQYRAPLSGVFNWGGSFKKTLTVKLPRGLELSDVTVRCVSAKIDADGVTANVADLKSTSGSVSARSFDCGNITLSSTSGSVSARDCTARLTLTATSTSGSVTVDNSTANEIYAKSISGSVTVNGTSETLSAKTTSGRVSAAGSFGDVTAASVSGSVSVTPGAGVRYVKASSTSGSVSITLPDLAAGFTANWSSVSGKFNCDFPVTSTNKKAVYNGGGVGLDLSTVSGGIRVYKVN